MAGSNDFSQNKAWFKDGIIFTHLEGILNLEGVIDIQEKVHMLVVEHDIAIAPLICDLSDVDDTKSEASISGLGKVVMAYNTFRHLSGIWVVGAGKSVRKTADIFNRFFMNNRMVFTDTMEEATAAAKQLLSEDEPLV